MSRAVLMRRRRRGRDGNSWQAGGSVPGAGRAGSGATTRGPRDGAGLSATPLRGAAVAGRAGAGAVLVAEADAPLGKVVGRELHRDLVAGEYPDTVLLHLARDVGIDLDPIVEDDAKARVRQHLRYRSFHLDQFFLG